MKTLDRYLTGQLVRAFVVTLVAFTGLFTLIDLLTHRLNAMMDNDVPWSVVGQYYVALIPRLLADDHFAGLAMLFSSLLIVGSFAQRNELTAALAGGISLVRIVFAPILFAAVFSLALLALSEFVGPSAARTAIAIEREYLGSPGSAEEMRRGPMSWAELSGGWTCHVGKFNPVAMTGEDVLLLATHAGAEEQIRANRMYWDRKTDAWMLEDGLKSVYPDHGVQSLNRRITLERAPIIETPEALFAPLERPAVRTLAELRSLMNAAHARGAANDPIEVEWHARFARAAMPFVMLCLAVPLAARIRKSGRAAGIALGVGLGLAYFVLYSITQNLGLNGRINPPVAVWAPNGIFLITAGALYLRTPR